MRSSVRIVPCSEPDGASPGRHSVPSESTRASVLRAVKPRPSSTAASKVSRTLLVSSVSTVPSTSAVKAGTASSGAKRFTAKTEPSSWKTGGECGLHSRRSRPSRSTLKRAAPCVTAARSFTTGS